jgi:5'-nucleotidase / UDP-sugar diphosphatase
MKPSGTWFCPALRTRALALLLLLLPLSPTAVLANGLGLKDDSELIQAAYLSYYGRSGDPAGVDFWTRQLATSGGSVEAIIGAFSASTEFAQRYPASLGDAELIDLVYRQLLGRAPDAAGKAFYLQALADGRIGRDRLMLDVLNGVTGADVPVVENKLQVSADFTSLVAQTGAAFDADTKADNITLLASVTADPATVTAAQAASQDFVSVYTPLAVLHINDHHSHLEPNGRAELNLNGVDTGVETGGFARVVSKMLELGASHPNRLLLHAGDAITGTIFYTSFKGQADADLMNQVCFDAFVLGNHEFDDSDAGLAQFLGFLHANPDLCATPVLSANLVPQVGTPLRPDASASLVEPYVVYEVGGQQVGIIGLTIAGKTQNSSSPLASTQFLDETETAQRMIDELSAQGVNRIILLSHYGYENEVALAQNIRGADIIVGGDSHTLLGEAFADFGLNPQGPYPTVASDLDGHPVCVVQAWQYAEVVGELLVDFDRAGQVRNCRGTPHLLLGDRFTQEIEVDGSSEDVELSGDALQAVVDLITATPELDIVTPDPNAQGVLDGYAEQVDALRETVIGRLEENLCLERVPGDGRSSLCPMEATQANGGDVQQLVTEAFLQRSFEADIALQNAGGVRIDLPAGEITIDTAFTLLPFANTLVNLEMTGAEIKQVLEEAVSNFVDNEGSTGSYPYGANLRWNLDLSQPAGSRFSNVEIRFKDSDTWVALADDAQVTVVTNSFLAGGRDGWFTFGDVSADGRILDTFIDYAQAFIDYLQQNLGGAAAGDPVLPVPPLATAVACSDYSTQQFTNLEGELLLPDPTVGRACEP